MTSHAPAQRFRILHVLVDLSDEARQSAVLRHLEMRDETRFDIAVAFFGPPTDLLDQYAATGVRLHSLERPLSERWGLIVDLRRLLGGRGVDLLHAHTSGQHPSVANVALTAALFCRVPVVIDAPPDRLPATVPDGAAQRARRALGAAMQRGLRHQLERRLVVQRFDEPAANGSLGVASAPGVFEQIHRRALRIPDEEPSLGATDLDLTAHGADCPDTLPVSPTVLTPTKG